MDKTLINPFVKGSIATLKEMAEIDLEESTMIMEEGISLNVNGYASIVGFSGKIEGWVMISIDKDLAKILTSVIIGDEPENINKELISATVAELCNIIVGSGNTVLNEEFSFRLRCSPPVIIFGEESNITLPQIKSTIVNLKSTFGVFKMIIAYDNKMFI